MYYLKCFIFKLNSLANVSREPKSFHSTATNLVLNSSSVTLDHHLGSYLAGLIEGDGSIIVPKTHRSEKGKLLYPKIKITFVQKDLPLAKKLQSVLGKGTINHSSLKTYLDLCFYNMESLKLLISLINGKFRTPKIEALNRLILWFNKREDCKEKFCLLPLDNSALSSNSWLCGFIESDGSFYIGFSVTPQNNVTSVKSYMRLSQRMYYHKNLEGNKSDNCYLPVMEEIREFLDISKIRNIKRIKGDYKIEKGYEIRTDRKESRIILINYLTKFPLYSSKYLDYLDWVQIIELQNRFRYKAKPIDYNNTIIDIKGNMNSLRKKFNWKHLDFFFI